MEVHILALHEDDDDLHVEVAGILCWEVHSQAWHGDGDALYEEVEDTPYWVAHTQVCCDGEVVVEASIPCWVDDSQIMDGGQGDGDALEEHNQMRVEDRICWVPCSQALGVRGMSHDMRVTWEADTPLQEAHSEASLSLLSLVGGSQHVGADNL